MMRQSFWLHVLVWAFFAGFDPGHRIDLAPRPAALARAEAKLEPRVDQWDWPFEKWTIGRLQLTHAQNSWWLTIRHKSRGVNKWTPSDVLMSVQDMRVVSHGHSGRGTAIIVGQFVDKNLMVFSTVIGSDEKWATVWWFKMRLAGPEPPPDPVKRLKRFLCWPWVSLWRRDAGRTGS